MSVVDAASTDGVLQLGTRRGRLALVSTVAASGMASLDATVVNVALPRIGEDLDASVSVLQWVLTGYLLALASLILVGGSLGDHLGRRRVFVVGTVWFAAASLLCGVAPNVEILIAARVLQGIGGALLTPGSLALLQASFAEGDRAKAVGAWSGLTGIASAVGPLLGGWLVDGPGWRWAFLVNLPVAAVVVASARHAVPETRDPHASARIDVVGAALGVVALAAATWSLTSAGERGWGDGGVLGPGLIAVTAGAWFVRHQRLVANPLVPPALFARRAFVVTNLATVLLYAGLGVTFFLVAYELQVAAGWSALEAGSALLPTTLLMLLLSARSGASAERIGPRWPLTIGPLVAAAGLWLLAGMPDDVSWARDVLPGSIVLGLGLVTFVAPLTETVMGSVPPDQVSIASGVNNAVARTAGLAALAVIPVVSGLTDAADPSSVGDAAGIGLRIAAVLAALAAPLAFIGLDEGTGRRRSARRLHCATDGPPLQPDPARCAVAAS